MIVRIKLRVGQNFIAPSHLDSKIASGVASLLTPAAVLCFVVAVWRVLADVNITEEFAIRAGFLSHWQVWLALGIGIQTASVLLDRYGRRLDRQF